MRLLALVPLAAALLIPNESRADVSLEGSPSHPSKVVAPGLAVSIVFGDEPAFAAGIDAQYLAFDQPTTSINERTTGKGVYAQSQLYFPFGPTPMHFRHGLGVHTLRGMEITEGADGWTAFRFGAAYRHAAGGVAASYGPSAEPMVGAGEYALVWLGLRFTPSVSDAVSKKKSHGWETALTLGVSLPFSVGGWPYGSVS
jgi:hypothetical protein